MAYAVEYRAEFYDTRDSYLYRVDILKEGYTTPVNTITYMNPKPVTLKKKGKKDKDPIILGKEFKFNFYSTEADNDKYDSIFEADYKDYKVNYYKDSVLIWTGYLKPDSLDRTYIDKAYFIELVATDGFADLKEFRTNTFGRSMFNRGNVLSVIKDILNNIGFELDFHIQLGIWEKNQMTSSDNALEESYVQESRFWDTEDGVVVYKDTHSVLEALLKPFNCTIEQSEGKYYIVNSSEVDSFKFIYDWSTLTQQSRTANDLAIDIDSYDFKNNSNLYKREPYRKITTRLNNRYLGGELLPNLNLWGITPAGSTDWTIHFGQPVDATVTEDSGEVTLNSTDDAYDCYLDTANFTASVGEGNRYISFGFEILLESHELLGTPLPTAFWIMSIEITRPDTTVHTIDYSKMPVGGGFKAYSTYMNEAARITATGTYQIRIQFNRTTSNWDDATWKIKNVTLTEQIAIDGEDDTDVSYDHLYISELSEGKIEAEELLIFGDTGSINDIASITIGSSATLEWNRYGKTDELLLQELYSIEQLTNRQRYKNYIRLDVYDPDDNIASHNKIELNSRFYNIVVWDKNYRNNWTRLELDEILTGSISPTSDGGTELTSVDGESAPTVITIPASGGGDVGVSGTPANNQIAIWTNSSTIEGSSNFIYDSVAGEITVDNTTLNIGASSMFAEQVTFDGDTSAGLRLYNSSGYISLTPLNSGWAHIYTDKAKFIFNRTIWTTTNAFSSYDAAMLLQVAGVTEMTIDTDSVSLAETSVIKVGAWTNPSSYFDMSLGFKVDTALIGGMDFQNTNTVGQVRLMARNDGGDYLVMNVFNSAATGTVFGTNRTDTHAIFGQATTDANKKLSIGTYNAGDLILGTANTARMTILANGGINLNSVALDANEGDIVTIDSTSKLLSYRPISGLDFDNYNNWVLKANGEVGAGYSVESGTSGTVNFAAGTGISIARSTNTITITNTASGGSGAVDSVTAGDTSIAIGGTSADPTVAVNFNPAHFELGAPSGYYLQAKFGTSTNTIAEGDHTHSALYMPITGGTMTGNLSIGAYTFTTGLFKNRNSAGCKFYSSTSAYIALLADSGDWHVDGNVYANSTTTTSDARLKENVVPLYRSLDKIKKLNGVTFNWRHREDKSTHIGLIAQDVEKVVPEIVSSGNKNGYKGIDYSALVPLLIEGMKDQQRQINKLNRDLNKLKK